jgi:hypothetical protein
MREIEQGTLWLVSDGSFNPSMHTGTAAWILEGISSKVHISGKIITPGEPTDQSAYRSELAGILAALTVINFSTTYYNVTGTITLHCDCKKGIEKAFNLNRISTLQDSSNDILKAIHQEVKHSKLNWFGTHVRGHQDDAIPYEHLDRPSQLNVLVDQVVKDLMPLAMASHQQRIVRSSSWGITIGSIPIIHDINEKLYDVVHIRIAKHYWTKKARIRDENFDFVNWSRLGQALDKMSLAKRLFCSKHTCGMCGVGKFQKLWRAKETDACPHCGKSRIPYMSGHARIRLYQRSGLTQCIASKEPYITLIPTRN